MISIASAAAVIALAVIVVSRNPPPGPSSRSHGPAWLTASRHAKAGVSSTPVKNESVQRGRIGSKARRGGAWAGVADGAALRLHGHMDQV
jgi:hypothetical protein